MDGFSARLLADVAAGASSLMALLGHELGLFESMTGAGPMTSAELAQRTGTAERYVREWLDGQAAAGYVEYDPSTRAYTLSDEHAAVLAEPSNPRFMVGALEVLAALCTDRARLAAAFRTGDGIPWSEHSPALVEGLDRLNRASFGAFLVDCWIPAMGDVADRLAAGAHVAVADGHGGGAIDVLTEAYPRSRVAAFDGDGSAAAYDLVCFFDCLHDSGDPVGVSGLVRRALRPDGAWLIVEPGSADRRFLYALSTAACVPGALAQDMGLALGAQPGEHRLRQVVTDAGFTEFRRVADGPWHTVYRVLP